jgi:translation initiation factor 3 subunit K
LPGEPCNIEAVRYSSPSRSCSILVSQFEFLHSYQFNPDLYNPDVVINILTKALTALPFPDFNLCISLLDDRAPSAILDEPDPLPTLLPSLKELHTLLQQCRFPAFWAVYRSEQLDAVRDNFTVECVGFEDAVRDVVINAVKAAFIRIGTERLGSYLDLEGKKISAASRIDTDRPQGQELEAYIAKLGWTVNSLIVSIPPNPDNQIESTVVQENIKLGRALRIHFELPRES